MRIEMKLALVIILITFFIASVMAIGELYSIEITPTSLSIDVGDSKTLTSICKDQDGIEIACTTLDWSSSVPSVATVDSYGKVTGKSEGSADITAIGNNAVTSNNVVVDVKYLLGYVQVVPMDPEVFLGDTQQFKAVCRNTNAKIMPCKYENWSSSDPSVGTIDQTGLFNATSIGSTNVIVEVEGIKSNPSVVTVIQKPIGLVITNWYPTSLLIDGHTPYNETFNIITNQPANIKWNLDGVNIPGGSMVTTDSISVELKMGSHTLNVVAQNGTQKDSKTWNLDIKGTLKLLAGVPSVKVGYAKNVTFTVTRKCGIIPGDTCIGDIPVPGTDIILTGVATGSNVTDINGTAVIQINATNNGTIIATASKSGFEDKNISITAEFYTPTPTPTNPGGIGNVGTSSGSSSSGSSSSGSSGGGGGGSSSPEPYINIFKYEVQENYITTNPTKFRYMTPELGIYEIEVVGIQNGDAAIRVELLKSRSMLVGLLPFGNSYKYYNIWIDNKRIKSAIIRYKVENSWITAKQLAPEYIKMTRWDNASKNWVDLPTTVINNDSNYSYLESKSEYGADSLSTSFALMGSKNTTYGPKQTYIEGEPATDIENISNNDTQTPKRGGLAGLLRPEAIISLVVIGTIIYLFNRKKI